MIILKCRDKYRNYDNRNSTTLFCNGGEFATLQLSTITSAVVSELAMMW